MNILFLCVCALLLFSVMNMSCVPRLSTDIFLLSVCQYHVRYYNEFMLEEPRSSSSTKECTTTRPLVRVKVVPASFGLEGFEEAVWEAYEEEMNHSDSNGKKCRSVTFVVAAPDIMDPNLMEGSSASPQVEFEPDRFRIFASTTLEEKLKEFEKIEGVSLTDDIELTSFHPLWKNSSDNECGIVSIDGSDQGSRYFPYPCVAVSTNVHV